MNVILNENEHTILRAVNNLALSMGGESERNVAMYLLWSMGHTQKEVAQMYGVGLQRVGQICRRVQSRCKQGRGLSQIHSKGVA